MKRFLKLIAAVLVGTGLFVPSAFALHSGLVGADGERLFSEDFVQDYESARKSVETLLSAEPLLALRAKYLKPEEPAELELAIGLVYNQRTGVVDPAKAVAHLTRALDYQLPERTCIKIWMWRGGSFEQLKKYPEALDDYLRALLACSYRDLTGGWPELLGPTVPLSRDPADPDGPQRIKDYQRYRDAIDLKCFLLMQRYYLIDGVKRVRAQASIDDPALLKAIQRLSPDTSRPAIISTLIQSENKRPWP